MKEEVYQSDRFRVIVNGDEIQLLDPVHWGILHTYRFPTNDPSLFPVLAQIFRDGFAEGLEEEQDEVLETRLPRRGKPRQRK